MQKEEDCIPCHAFALRARRGTSSSILSPVPLPYIALVLEEINVCVKEITLGNVDALLHDLVHELHHPCRNRSLAHRADVHVALLYPRVLNDIAQQLRRKHGRVALLLLQLRNVFAQWERVVCMSAKLRAWVTKR